MMGHVITDDELDLSLWYSHKTGKRALEVSAVPIKKEVYRVESINNVMLILFFDVQGAIYQHIVSRHRAINELY